MENINRIITGCINRESKFQRNFYDRYRLYASKIVFRYVYRYSRVGDVVTDGFVKAFESFPAYRITDEENPEKMVMSWLKRIMINCAIDELRRNNMLPEIGALDEGVWSISERNDDADRLMLYADLIMLVKQLPPNYRVVFNLYVLDGYSHSEIAEKLNIPIGTSRSHLSRAKTWLQERIKKMEDGKYAGFGT